MAAPLAGGAPRELLRLKEPESVNAGIAWTPDGRSVIFTKILSRNNRETELWVAPLDGSQARRIEGLKGYNPAVHPNGKQIAVLISNPSRSEVWVMENFLPAQASKQSEKK